MQTLINGILCLLFVFHDYSCKNLPTYLNLPPGTMNPLGTSRIECCSGLAKTSSLIRRPKVGQIATRSWANCRTFSSLILSRILGVLVKSGGDQLT